MTPALLSFLADSLNESWNGFWDLITKANRLIDTDKANAETNAAVKAELEDLITLYRQNRVFILSSRPNVVTTRLSAFYRELLGRLDAKKLVDVIVLLHWLSRDDRLLKDLGLLSSHSSENPIQAKR